jgi:cell volume regulation protein A
MHAIFALTAAATLYGATAVAHGSGFLAVFVLGLALSDVEVAHHREIVRFGGTLATVAELVVFVALGLTIHVGLLSTRDWLEGVAIAVVLGLVVRPVVVAATLARADLRRNEKAFIAWSGLKGAVPILLAAFGVLQAVDEADRIYGIVFVVVLVSVLGQGTLVPAVARRLGIPMHAAP